MGMYKRALGSRLTHDDNRLKTSCFRTRTETDENTLNLKIRTDFPYNPLKKLFKKSKGSDPRPHSGVLIIEKGSAVPGIQCEPVQHVDIHLYIK